jgi:DNA processing protein
MEDQALYQLALAHTEGIGPVYTKNLIEHFGDAASVFRADRAALERTGLPRDVVTAILEFSEFPALRAELRHLADLGARILFFTDTDYPQRLLPLPSAPALLFYQGAANLNADMVIAIAGTRDPTEYGKDMTAHLIRELACPDLLILSGLAYGIDAAAHRAALKYHLPTVGVLGHGLNHLYPAHHLGLSQSMRKEGGLLTSFLPQTGPEFHTFPVRNKLVAGLCDALIVIESSTEGGSLSAAKAAHAFNKKVFALPGRITDKKSMGCLQLINKGEALPFLSADHLKAAMGWDHPAGHDSYQPALPFSPTEAAESERRQSVPQHSRQPTHAAPQQPIEPAPRKVNAVEARLINLLTGKQPLTFEDFITLTRLPIPKISLTLLNLEIKGIIRSLPGRRYLLAS